jgi:hypothetical protein
MDGRLFLSWSRFPFVSEAVAGSGTVRLDDIRYARPGQQSFAAVAIPMNAPPPPRE